MKTKNKVSFILLLLSCLVCLGRELIIGSEAIQKPQIIFTDSYGRQHFDDKNPFVPLDSIFGSFTGLEPNRTYTILVKGPDKKIISSSTSTADENGIIPTRALWWDIGVTYENGVGEINRDFLKYKYTCVLKQGERTVHEKNIPISANTGKSFIYSSDKNGNPRNTFRLHEENVYLSGKFYRKGKNMNTPLKLYIYLLKDRCSWRTGDYPEDLAVQKYVKKSPGDQEVLEFTQLIWQQDDMEAGSYDIVLTTNSFGILFQEHDLIDDNYGVGFSVIAGDAGRAGNNDIIRPLACQAPPISPGTGMLAEPHPPVYKDYFAPIEDVWAAVNLPGLNYTDKTARLYVIPGSPGKELADKALLNDVSGGYEEVIIQPGCGNILYTRLWHKPVIREQGYDVVLDFPPFGIYNRGRDILDTGDAGGFHVPEKWVCLESVSFNHSRNSIYSDAITIRRSGEMNVQVPEWTMGKQASPAAYIANSRVTLKPVFKAAPGISSVQIKAYKNSGGFVDLKERKILFYNNGESYPSYLDVYFDTPERIKSFYQAWDWYLYRVNNDNSKEESHIVTTVNKVYIVLAVPQGPWTTGEKTAPWARVLDISTRIAENESSAEGAAGKINRFLYEAVGASYDRDNKRYSTDGESSVYSNFKLTAFLDNIPHVNGVNCYDMAKALVIFSNALGCCLDLRYCRNFGALNCVKPVGINDWDCSIYFYNHAFAAHGYKIFDASIKIDTWGDRAKPPFRETWMTNIPWWIYTEALVKKKPRSQPLYPEIVSFEIEDSKE